MLSRAGGAMRNYRVYCLDVGGRIALADWLEASDDDDAIHQAKALKNGARKCEVWQRDRLIITLGTEELEN